MSKLDKFRVFISCFCILCCVEMGCVSVVLAVLNLPGLVLTVILLLWPPEKL